MDENRSLWLASDHAAQAFDSLHDDLDVDVAIIGAGITGLTTAHLLKREGANVALIDRGIVAGGTTGYTTAKVTALQGLMYGFLEDTYDTGTARIYADANKSALDLVASLAVDCDLRRLPTLTYTTLASDVPRIEKEVAAARRAGLDAELVAKTDLPFDVAAAVRLDDQIHFHPHRYCAGLAAGVGAVYEHTEATDVKEGSPCVVTTSGGVIRAEHVVVATQLPFVDRGLFFAKASPSRSYCVAGRVDDPPEGMYISSEQPIRSVRPHFSAEATWLIVAGEGHKVGQDEDAHSRYRALDDFAREHFGMTSESRWSAQDYMPADGLPYIGRISSRSQNVFVATGFQKWGLSTATFAAMILCDLVYGRSNPWHETFDSTRIDLPRSARALVKENVNVAAAFVGDRVRSVGARSIEDLAPGEGDVVRDGSHAVAAYRDEDGALHVLSAKCTHLGCLVRFNAAEKSWDCPCHGSRFALDGSVLEGPATTALEPTDGAPHADAV